MTYDLCHTIYVTRFINQTTANGWTALHIACEKQSLRKVQQLLEAGANINTTTDLGRTPLHIACDKKSAEISLELLNVFEM